jgi:hypothetical protein
MIGRMSRSRATLTARPPAVAAMLALALPLSALASASSIKVTGPSSVKIGTRFVYKVSGFAASPANFLAIWEAPPTIRCARTYDREYNLSSSLSYIGGKHLKAGRDFSRSTTFTAKHAGTHYLCAYLINLRSTKTYAHAAAHWSDHT